MLTSCFRSLLLSLCLLPLWCSTAAAGEAPVYTPFFNQVAVSGYDPVAYFTEQKPVKGDPQFKTTYQGAQWHFSSAENRDRFLSDPEKYAPQYGGYCAWAVSQGNTASADPQRWKIVGGKLYLNYDADVQKKWEAGMSAFIKTADQNWPAVLGK